MSIEHWRLPETYILTRIWHHGHHLIIADSGNTSTVIDLSVHPPHMKLWPVAYLHGLEPLEGGGWAVLSRTGSTAADIRFPIWHHDQALPHKGSKQEDLLYQDGAHHMDGLTTYQGRLFAWSNLALGYDPPDYLIERVDGALVKVEGMVSTACREAGTALCGDGTEVLLWDGDGWQWEEGRWRRLWGLGLKVYDKIWTVPWPGERGFYYTKGPRLYRIKADQPPELLTSQAPAWNLSAGPGDTLIGATVPGKQGHMAYIIFPGEGKGIVLKRKDLPGTVRGESAKGFFYSPLTRMFYLYTWRLWTIPEDLLMKRRASKLKV